MEPDAEHIGAKPAPARHNIAKDREGHDSAGAGQATPAGMQDNRVPNHDEEGTIFFWVPAPESAPRLIGPDATKNGAYETEQCGETYDTVDHAFQRFRSFLIQRLGEYPAEEVYHSEETG